MFLKFKTDVNEIEVVRDSQEVIDILYVQPEEQGTLILCSRDFDGEEKWETLSIEYAVMDDYLTYFVDGEERKHNEIWCLCDDNKFVRMSRLIPDSMFINKSKKFFS